MLTNIYIYDSNEHFILSALYNLQRR